MQFSGRSCLVSLLLLGGCAQPAAEVGDTPSLSFILSDVEGDRLLRFDAQTGARIDTDASWGAFEGPAGTCVSADGDSLFVTSFATGALARFDAPGGPLSDELFLDRVLLEEPVGVMPYDGDLLVLGNDTRNVVRLAPDGAVVDTFGDYALKEPHDFALGPDGLLYIGTAGYNAAMGTVQVFDPDTGERVRDFAPVDDVADAVGLAFDGDTLLVSDWFGGRLLRYDPVTGEQLEVVADELSGPLDLLVLDDGVLLMDRDDVLRIDDDSVETLVYGVDHGLEWPRGLTLAE